MQDPIVSSLPSVSALSILGLLLVATIGCASSSAPGRGSEREPGPPWGAGSSSGSGAGKPPAASRPDRPSGAPSDARTADPSRRRRVAPPSEGRDALARELLGRARDHLGVPYRWAGDDVTGFDCSGFTSFVYRDLGLGLPRTTAEQSRMGRWVALDEVAPGDLVFFGPGRKQLDHVGIVVSGPGEPLTMIHASSSRGVTETVIERSPYWLRVLRLARRILPSRR